jgi:hypothetical protein
MVHVIDVPPLHVDPDDDDDRPDDCVYLRDLNARQRCLIQRIIYFSYFLFAGKVQGCADVTYRHGPDGDGVALQRVPEVGHHVLADEPVERLDEVEPHVDGDEKGQHDPVVQVQPRDLASVGLQVRVRGAQADERRCRRRRRRRHLLLSLFA